MHMPCREKKPEKKPEVGPKRGSNVSALAARDSCSVDSCSILTADI